MRTKEMTPGANCRIPFLLNHDYPPITDICICNYSNGRIVCICNDCDCNNKEKAMSVKEISRLALSEALLSRSPPIVFAALDKKYYDSGHIPTARMLPP
jgi:hypothetical protein